MVTIYRSIDGKEFTSETACKKHEREAVLSSNIKNEIVFYDENGQQIDFFEGIEDFDNTVWYILAKNEIVVPELSHKIFSIPKSPFLKKSTPHNLSFPYHKQSNIQSPLINQ